MVNEILNNSINDFINAVKETSEYKNYKNRRNNIMANPELRGKTAKLMAEHYKLLTTTPDSKLLEAEMAFSDKYEDIYTIPEIHDFLEAETRFNDMLRDVLERVTGGLSL